MSRGAFHNAQHLLGHATLGTTDAYLSKPTLDALRASIDGISLSMPQKRTANPLEATTGIEPVEGLFQALEQKVSLYVEHFRGAGGGSST